MAIYSDENIRKIKKLSPREFPHLVQNRKNICTRNMAYTVLDLAQWILSLFAALSHLYKYTTQADVFFRPGWVKQVNAL